MNLMLHNIEQCECNSVKSLIEEYKGKVEDYYDKHVRVSFEYKTRLQKFAAKARSLEFVVQVEKRCGNPKCKYQHALPVEMFQKNKRRKDGLQYWCKHCVFNAYKARHTTTREYEQGEKKQSIRPHKCYYKKGKDGRPLYYRNWYIRMKDHIGTVHLFSGFVSKKRTILLGKQIQRLVNFKQADKKPDEQMAKFIDEIPSKLRLRLVTIGLLDRSVIAAGKTFLKEHLKCYLTMVHSKAKEFPLWCTSWRQLPAIPAAVYALCKDTKVQYIGQSRDLYHRVGCWTRSSIPFDSVFYIPLPIELLDSVEHFLIELYKPPFNKKKGNVVRSSESKKKGRVIQNG